MNSSGIELSNGTPEREAEHGQRVGQQRRPGGHVMGSSLFHVGATAMCPHGGQVSTTPGSPRVKVGGQPVATIGGHVHDRRLRVHRRRPSRSRA